MSSRRTISGWVSLMAICWSVGCAVESSEETGDLSGDGTSVGGKADGPGGACFVPATEPLGESEPDLVATGDIPLPSLGPTRDGWFHPAGTYSEGGTFVAAEHRAEWAVGASEIAKPAEPGKLRVVEWNVERGNELDAAIRLMKRVNADVWILNETDLYGTNSGGVVVAREIARALGYSYYTTSEFYEKREDRRGVSGNAIVSRYPLEAGRRMAIPMYLSDGGYDWAKSSSEPRCGQRSAMSAKIEAPTADGGTTQLSLVALHTENKANAKVRRKQFDAVVAELVTPGEATIVAGDLNTISIGEGASFRKYLSERYTALGPEKGQFDCSRNDNSDTFSAAGVVRMRIDWMLLQPGSAEGPSCPVGSYKVIGNDGASDHKPVVTEFSLGGG